MTSVEKLRLWQEAITASIEHNQMFNAVKILEAGGSPWKIFECYLKEQCNRRGINYSLERYHNATTELRKEPGRYET